MPNVVVKPINSVSVKVNQGAPQVVKGTTTFVGATNVTDEVNFALQQSNNAFLAATTAELYANTGYDFVTMGGTVAGNVAIANDLIVQGNSAYIAGNVYITGDFVGTIDGGLF